MKSSIKIDFLDRGTGVGMEPVIVANIVDSDDPRDKLVKYLFESLGQDYLQICYTYRETKHPTAPYEQSVILFKPEKTVLKSQIQEDWSDVEEKELKPVKNNYE